MCFLFFFVWQTFPFSPEKTYLWLPSKFLSRNIFPQSKFVYFWVFTFPVFFFPRPPCPLGAPPTLSCPPLPQFPSLFILATFFSPPFPHIFKILYLFVCLDLLSHCFFHRCSFPIPFMIDSLPSFFFPPFVFFPRGSVFSQVVSKLPLL